MKHLGLIGKKLEHSFSKKYFDQKFVKEGISGYDFELFEIPAIEPITRLVRDKKLSGFSVTIPYKEAILPHCFSLSPEAEEIGAVNCVRVAEGELYGHNTDYIGFLAALPLDRLNTERNALIFGSGGASKAVIYALEKLNFNCITVSSTDKDGTIKYEDIDRDLMEQTKLLVNCTPLGTFPEAGRCIPIPYQYIHPGHVCYDLVYNPPLSEFLKRSEEQGATIINGQTMLEQQAEAAWKIWTDNTVR